MGVAYAPCKKKTFELRQSSGFCVSQYGRVWEWRMLQEKNQLAVLMIFWGTLMIHRWIYGYPIFNLWFEQVDEGRAEGMVPTCPRLCCRPGVHLQNVFPNSNQTWLVVSTPLKNMKVSWDDYSKYTENHQPEVFWTFGRQICYCLQSDMAGNQSFAIHTHLQINSVNPIINHPHHHQKKMV